MHRYFEQKEYHLMREGHRWFREEIAPDGFMSYGSAVRSNPAKYFRVTRERENADASTSKFNDVILSLTPATKRRK